MPGIALAFSLQHGPVLGQLLQLRTAQHEVDVEGAAADVEAGDVADLGPHVAELAEAPPQLLHHVALGVVAAERGQRLAALAGPSQKRCRLDRALGVGHGAHVARSPG